MAVTNKQHLEYLKKYGVARTNRFQVQIPLPQNLIPNTVSVNQPKTSGYTSDILKLIKSFSGSGSNEVSRGLEMMTEQSEIPGKNLTTTDIKYNGDFFKLPYAVVYGAQPFTFKVTQDMYEKNIIDDWMELVYDSRTHEIGYMDEYSTDITINQLNMKDEVVYSAVLKDAFPIVCNPIVLSNEEFNQSHKLMVTFAYRKWIRAEDLDKSNSLLDSLSQTPFGPYLQPILSNPVVQKGLDVLEDYTGVDLEGDALAVYEQVDSIVRTTTGKTINQTVTLLEGIRASIGINDNISPDQAARVLDMIDGVLSNLKG